MRACRKEERLGRSGAAETNRRGRRRTGEEGREGEVANLLESLVVEKNKSRRQHTEDRHN